MFKNSNVILFVLLTSLVGAALAQSPAPTPAPAAAAPASLRSDSGVPAQTVPVAYEPAPFGGIGGPERIVPGRIDEKGRLVLRERMGGNEGLMAMQAFELELRGKPQRRVEMCPVTDVIIERTIDLSHVAAVGRTGGKVEAGKLAAVLNKSWSPMLICYADTRDEKVDATDLPKPAAIMDRFGKDSVLLKVPYPMVGHAATRILDLSTSYPSPPTHGEARVDEKNRLIVLYTVTKMLPEQRVKEESYQVQKGEVSETQTKYICYTVWKPVYETCVREANEGDFADADGKPVAIDKVRESIGGVKTVLIASDGEQVHSFYRKGVSADTLFFTTPAVCATPAPDVSPPAPTAAPAVVAPPPPAAVPIPKGKKAAKKDRRN